LNGDTSDEKVETHPSASAVLYQGALRDRQRDQRSGIGRYKPDPFYGLRRVDAAFAAAWEEAEETATDRLEEEARRHAVERVPEPPISGGRLVRDNDGRPIAFCFPKPAKPEPGRWTQNPLGRAGNFG
jgi:hypothetical protein